VDKVFLKIVRDAKGIKVDGIRNSPGKHHMKPSAPCGGYHPRKQRNDDYSEKALHKDAEVRNTAKPEHSVNRAEGKSTVNNQKWVKKESEKEQGEEQENAVMPKSPSQPKRCKPKKQTEPSPQRPNKKRMPRTEKEAENEEGKEEEKEEVIMLPKKCDKQTKNPRKTCRLRSSANKVVHSTIGA
jgi:hypothetical protein